MPAQPGLKEHYREIESLEERWQPYVLFPAERIRRQDDHDRIRRAARDVAASSGFGASGRAESLSNC